MKRKVCVCWWVTAQPEKSSVRDSLVLRVLHIIRFFLTDLRWSRHANIIFIKYNMTIINNWINFLIAVRADRMRGGRNKFGPMYKRDRARKLQVMRERQLTTPRSGNGGNSNPSPNNSNSGAGQSSGMYTDMGYSPSGSSVYGGGGSSGGGVKHEIQIAQVSSLTSSPDSSPSPLAASLGYPGQSFNSFFCRIWQICFFILCDSYTN